MNVCMVCIDALRLDHVTPEVMPHLTKRLDSGLWYYGVKTKTPWTPSSVAAMLLGKDDAFSVGPKAMIGHPSIAGRLHGTHDTGAFIGNATLTTEHAMWVFRDFDYVWSCAMGVVPVYRMDGVWAQFFAWREQRTRPWFAYLHLWETHEPYQVPNDEEPPAPDCLKRWPYMKQGLFARYMDLDNAVLPVAEEAKEYLRQRYKVYCKTTDKRLRGYFEQVIDDDTVLVVVSDHGDSHDDEGRWGHGSKPCFATEATCRVLCGIIGPGIQADRIDASMLSNAEIPDLLVNSIFGNRQTNAVDQDKVAEQLRALGYLG